MMITMHKKISLAMLVLFFMNLPLYAGVMKKYEAKYHIIYSDLPQEDVYEAISRVNAMAEQYHNRTKGFGGKITRKLPFFLYANYDDYQTAIGGQLAGSVGVYTGKELRAAADSAKFSKEDVWHTVQHEGFHQFVDMVITNGRHDVMPIWLNEGMAEYFGEAKWTGDKLIPGVVDTGKLFKKGKNLYKRSGRMQRVQESIKDGKFKPFPRMVTMSHDAWNSQMDIANYDQAWSMVHFFVHAQDSAGNYKYRKKFQKYLESVVKGNDNAKSFCRYLGSPTKLEREYNEWWLSWDKNPSQDICDRILIETLVNFMSRADAVCKMKFQKADDFFSAAKKDKIKIDSSRFRNLWLPQSLLDEAVSQAELNNRDCTWDVKREKGKTVFIMIHKDGSEVQCLYKTRGASLPLVKTTFISADDTGKKSKNADDDDD
ncbi:MAG TPA: DUF1570 domain-containing protein [Phycisphaerae bacterium]|nr:DUF1570 domain-containing protein [Phycisphaerae bacterium]